MSQKSGAARRHSAQGFTEKQGQYLAFIYTYSRMFRRPPAETDMQRHFRVSPPSVHQMTTTSHLANAIYTNNTAARHNNSCRARSRHRQVIAAHSKRRRRVEFLGFMNGVVAAFPDRELHVILDNLNTHKKNERGSRSIPTCNFISRRHDRPGSIRSKPGSPSCSASRSAALLLQPSRSYRSISMHSSARITKTPNRSRGPRKRSINAASKADVSLSCDSAY